MARFSHTLWLLALFAPLAAASAAGARLSTTRDALGHRPGARGFSTVILDAGHGGKDPGATSRITGLREKDLALDLVERVRRELSGKVRTVLTRGSDVFVELDDRVRLAARTNDAVLVSIHCNAGPPHAAGPEVYFWRVDSFTLGKRIFTALARVAENHASRGLVRRRLRLTRNPPIACVLVECGYLSHGGEARLLATSAYRTRLAQAIARGILEQRALGDGTLGPLPAPLNAPLSKASDRRE